MTKEQIIDLLYNEIGNPDYKTVGDYHKGIADKLLTLIEQEKREQAREILEKITSPVNTMTSLGYTQYVIYQNDIDKLAEEYGVKL